MICFMTSFGFTLKTVDSIESGDKTTVKSKVLIATQESRFKSEVVSEIKKALGENVFYIKVVDLKWLPNESVDHYSAIAILNRCMACRTRGLRVSSIIFRKNLEVKNAKPNDPDAVFSG